MREGHSPACTAGGRSRSTPRLSTGSSRARSLVKSVQIFRCESNDRMATRSPRVSVLRNVLPLFNIRMRPRIREGSRLF